MQETKKLTNKTAKSESEKTTLFMYRKSRRDLCEVLFQSEAIERKGYFLSLEICQFVSGWA
jgi:hypothetical protein